MEKRRPTYDLEAIKLSIGSVDTLAITVSAFKDAVALGFDRNGIVPDTMIAPDDGQILTRGVRPFVVNCKGESLVVDLPGYYPEGSGDGVLVGKDMSGVDAALRELKEKVDGSPSPDTIRRVRTKLKLSQREAGVLLKVGENAFDKYERGLVEPSGPTSQLIKVLDRHPELVDDLR